MPPKKKKLMKTPKLENVTPKQTPITRLEGIKPIPDIGTLPFSLRVFNPMDSKSYDGWYYAMTDLMQTFRSFLSLSTLRKVVQRIDAKETHRCTLHVVQDMTQQTQRPICRNIVVLGWNGVLQFCQDERILKVGGDDCWKWIRDNLLHHIEI
jgi:hypothetical protein